MRTRTVVLTILFYAMMVLGGIVTLGGCAAEFDDLGSMHFEPPKGVRFAFGKPADTMAAKVEHYDPRNKRIGDLTLQDVLELRRQHQQQQITDQQLQSLRP